MPYPVSAVTSYSRRMSARPFSDTPQTFEDVLFYDTFTGADNLAISNQHVIDFNSFGVNWSVSGMSGVIASNKLKGNSTNATQLATLSAYLSSSYTIECDVTLSQNNWTGLVVRYQDSTHYYGVFFRLEGGANKVSLVEINGALFPTIQEAAVAITAGGTYNLKLVVVGNDVTVYVGGVSKFTAAMSLFGTSYGVGCVIATAAGDTSARFDNFKVTTPVTYTPGKAFLRKTDTNTITCYLPIPTETDSLVQTCYVIKKNVTALAGWGFASNTWSIDSAFIVKRNGTTAIPIYYATTVDGGLSAFEWAYKIGANADVEADFDFYGNNIHQAEQAKTAVFSVDGSTKTLSNGDTYEGDTMVLTQTRDIIYPKDKTTDIGDVVSTHTFIGSTGTLEVAHQHSYAAGYKIYSAYSAMLPTLYDWWELVKVGTGAEYTRVKDNSNQFKTTSSSAYMRSASHAYKITLNLPDNGPDINGDWSHASAFDRFFFQDLNSSKGKLYVTWVSTGFAERITATPSSHRLQYIVSR